MEYAKEQKGNPGKVPELVAANDVIGVGLTDAEARDGIYIRFVVLCSLFKVDNHWILHQNWLDSLDPHANLLMNAYHELEKIPAAWWSCTGQRGSAEDISEIVRL